MIVTYFLSSFLDNFAAKFFTNKEHSTPMPPLEPSTRGVNDPFSISKTLSRYYLFFSSSCFLKILSVSSAWLVGHSTCVTLMSFRSVNGNVPIFYDHPLCVKGKKDYFYMKRNIAPGMY